MDIFEQKKPVKWDQVELIAWDFDGVLNRNIVDGQFVWSKNMERDFGVPVKNLQDWLFRSGRFVPVLRGEADILDLITEWITDQGHGIDPAAFLDYWFERDDLPDPEMVAICGRLDFRQVIATNNEARRAHYIEKVSGWGARVEHIFAAGPMGAAKPEDAFFEQILEWSGLTPAQILLVDDSLANIEAAVALGWQGYYFTDQSRDAFIQSLRQQK